MKMRLDEVLEAADIAQKTGSDIDQVIKNKIEAIKNNIYNNYAVRARAMADIIEDGDGILTQLFCRSGVLASAGICQTRWQVINMLRTRNETLFTRGEAHRAVNP